MNDTHSRRKTHCIHDLQVSLLRSLACSPCSPLSLSDFLSRLVWVVRRCIQFLGLTGGYSR